MSASNPFRLPGLTPAVFTPLREDGSLDLARVPSLVDHLVEDGVSALYVLGSTGEGVSLTSAERRAVADAYITFNIEATYNTTDQVTDFLVNQIGELKKEIGEIEDRLQTYAESKGIVSIEGDNNLTLNALTDIARRRTEAQTRLAEKEAEFRSVSNSSPDALPEVLDSALIARPSWSCGCTVRRI